MWLQHLTVTSLLHLVAAGTAGTWPPRPLQEVRAEGVTIMMNTYQRPDMLRSKPTAFPERFLLAAARAMRTLTSCDGVRCGGTLLPVPSGRVDPRHMVREGQPSQRGVLVSRAN